MDPWKYVRDCKTTIRLRLQARDEAFTVSSTTTDAVVRFAVRGIGMSRIARARASCHESDTNGPTSAGEQYVVSGLHDLSIGRT